MIASGLLVVGSGEARAQCPPEPMLDNHTGPAQVLCNCFAPGEEAGAMFDVPAGDYPIEILKIGIGWSSQMGGAPDQLEEAIHIYPNGLPNPGTPQFSLAGPQLTDGAINEFNIEFTPGDKILNSGPFTVTLEFLNDNQAPGPPTMIHDGAGCIGGRNVVFADPGFWTDACFLGVSGNWTMHIVYRKLSCAASGAVPNGDDVPGTPLTADFDGANITLNWSASCSTTDTDYGVYEGILGSWYSHTQYDCTSGGLTTYTLPALGGGRYYLVVPHDGSGEGSYGTPTTGSRPQGSLPCHAQNAGACP